MHVVTVSTSLTTSVNMLLAFSVSEIRHGRKNCVYFLVSEKSPINFCLGDLRKIFIAILDVDVSNEMITKIINNYHVLNFTKLTHFLENIFIKSFKPNFNKYFTFKGLFKRPIVWRDFPKSGLFRQDCFHTCVQVEQFSWWEAYYEFFRSCRRTCRLQFYRRMDSLLYPFQCRTLWIVFQPFWIKNYNRTQCKW